MPTELVGGLALDLAEGEVFSLRAEKTSQHASHEFKFTRASPSAWQAGKPRRVAFIREK